LGSSTNANQHITMRPKGTGSFAVENGGANIFNINNGGGLSMKSNNWHGDTSGYLRFYFETNSTTYKRTRNGWLC
jgi:hypothetical protein